MCEKSEGAVENGFEAPTAGVALKLTVSRNDRWSAEFGPGGPSAQIADFTRRSRFSACPRSLSRSSEAAGARRRTG